MVAGVFEEFAACVGVEKAEEVEVVPQPESIKPRTNPAAPSTPLEVHRG